eukprot:1160918-Pelagomonas_calceolata.AAC.8
MNITAIVSHCLLPDVHSHAYTIWRALDVGCTGAASVSCMHAAASAARQLRIHGEDGQSLKEGGNRNKFPVKRVELSCWQSCFSKHVQVVDPNGCTCLWCPYNLSRLGTPLMGAETLCRQASDLSWRTQRPLHAHCVKFAHVTGLSHFHASYVKCAHPGVHFGISMCTLASICACAITLVLMLIALALILP